MSINTRLIEKRIIEQIDDYCVRTYDDGFRSHLGGSIIGEQCANALWLGFRWTAREVVNGRIHRLFQTGHREEPRFVEYLRGVGFTVHEVNPETGKQWQVSAYGGHFGGSMDGQGAFPESWEIPGKVLFEFKTNATGAGYNKVGNEGIEIAKPIHWAQSCTYGTLGELDWLVYLIKNKNDDDITVQVRPIDKALGARMVDKAGSIIASDSMMPKISENPTNRDCQYCKVYKVCHGGETPAKNCRSCKMAFPQQDGTWFCGQWQATIPGKAEMLAGCDNWSPIVNG